MEKLPLNVKGEIRQELSFEIVKTRFSLSEMLYVAEKTTPKLEMDAAFLLVHLNESSLSINEENAEISYWKVCRALLKTSGKSMTYSFTFFKR